MFEKPHEALVKRAGLAQVRRDEVLKSDLGSGLLTERVIQGVCTVGARMLSPLVKTEVVPEANAVLEVPSAADMAHPSPAEFDLHG